MCKAIRSSVAFFKCVSSVIQEHFHAIIFAQIYSVPHRTPARLTYHEGSRKIVNSRALKTNAASALYSCTYKLDRFKLHPYRNRPFMGEYAKDEWTDAVKLYT
jgi:hypothetical protein